MGSIGKVTEPCISMTNQQATDFLTVHWALTSEIIQICDASGTDNIYERKGDCLAKCLTMLGFMDLRQPRVFLRIALVLYAFAWGCPDWLLGSGYDCSSARMPRSLLSRMAENQVLLHHSGSVSETFTCKLVNLWALKPSLHIIQCMGEIFLKIWFSYHVENSNWIHYLKQSLGLGIATKAPMGPGPNLSLPLFSFLFQPTECCMYLYILGPTLIRNLIYSNVRFSPGNSCSI